MKNKIIITGLTGFVGKNLYNYLQSDYRIVGVSRRHTQKLISYDTLKVSDYDEAEAFIHLAGKAHDLKNTSNEKEYFDANTELTKQLFTKFLKSKCKIFIHLSSVKSVADYTEITLLETVRPNPTTPYGKSKLLAEEYILNQEIPDEKKVFVLRPCMIHGPNNKGNLNLLYNFVSKGIPYLFTKYENKRSFLSVYNLCYVIKELINNKSITSGVYNVADDESLSTKELVTQIGKAIDKKVIMLNVPKFMINLLAKVGDILPFPINSERVRKLTENYEVSNTKIKKVLKIKKLPLSTKEGIQRTIKSF